MRRLDEDEFQEAVSRGVISSELAERGMQELMRLESDVRMGRFPPRAIGRVKLPEWAT